MPKRTDGEAGDSIALVIEAMHQIAADPERWDQLIEALADAEPMDEAPPAVRAGLAQSQEIARLLERADRQPDTPAWLVLTARRKVAQISAGARAVIEAGLGTIAPDGALVFAQAENGFALDNAIARSRTQPGSQVILRLERDEALGPCFAYLVPAPNLPQAVGVADDALALVFPPSEETGRLWASLRESFGLTPAESRLARKLKDGRSLKDAADELSVSINTVRNQLRAIFDKMGLTRQSDLVRTLAELAQVAGMMEPAPASFSPVAPPIRELILGDGRRLTYRDYGATDGRAVLMFHEGLGSSLLPPGAQEKALSLGMRVVCVDRPGFGRSDPHPDYSFDAVALDVVELCGRIGLRQPTIVGMLSGAPSALQTAIRLGDEARGVLILSGRPPRPARRGGALDPVNLFRIRIEDHPWVTETLYAILRLRLSPNLVSRFMRHSIKHSPGDQAWLAAHPEAVDYVAAYVGEALDRTPRGAADEIVAFRRARNMTLAGLTAPLRIWHGEEDQFAPLQALLDFAGDLPAEVRVFPGMGHLLALRCWEAVFEDLAN
ncbi:alpha/beta fold hydrolase [Phenylobacterium sp.]|jgi:pimeloyl-ACP methyl ester carboxylesterase/DNA-binding CsgD family transcriptional regulator|uniref:alpha/beta fold hydrolase n=1 Tax=Phenylobacterium sp. TaxID=1871053 RepID=UPI0035B0AD9C